MKRTLTVILAVTVLLAGCASAQRSLSVSNDFTRVNGGLAPGEPGLADQAMAPAPTAAYYAESKSVAGGATVSDTTSGTQERMVIKNADLTVVVKDPVKSMNEISKMADSMGGFVVTSNLYQTYAPSGDSVPEATLTIRVPAAKLDEALSTIKDAAKEVQNENVSGQDITSTYVDLQSQLKNLEAAEKQLTEIMSKAEKTEDVMNVYNQLISVRGQIESIKGQMKYYEESVALSSISVRLIAEQTVAPIQVGGWQIKGWARDAVQSLLNFLQDFTKFLINLVISFLPKLLIVALVFGLPIWAVVRAVRNRRRKTQATEEKK